MTILSIPTPTEDTPFCEQTTTLDGTPYVLEFRYNQREGVWYVSVSTIDGGVIVSGIKVVPGVPLLRKVIDARRPPGELVAFTNSDDDSPPGASELGIDRRVTLCYVPASDV